MERQRIALLGSFKRLLIATHPVVFIVHLLDEISAEDALPEFEPRLTFLQRRALVVNLSRRFLPVLVNREVGISCNELSSRFQELHDCRV
jgi:hypothetical protein